MLYRLHDNIIMPFEGIIGSISLKKIFFLIGGDFEEIILKNEKSHEVLFI